MMPQPVPQRQAIDGYAFGSARYAWFVVLVMCGLQIASNMERQLLTLVVEPLRRDFHIGDIDVSLLQGLAFALFYSVVAVPIGWGADRWRRDRIIMLGIGFWALATIGCMIARSFNGLFLARMIIGLGEAALLPAAYSLLGDYFPRDKVAGAVGVVTGASFFGSGASLLFGGLLIGLLPQDRDIVLPLFGTIHGWQLAFGIMGIPGVALMLTMLAVREPPRRKGLDEDAATLAPATARETIGYLTTHWRFLAALTGGLVLLGTYQYGVTSWTVTYFIRSYGWSAARIGVVYGLYFMLIGGGASVVGGRLCDAMIARGRSDANFFIPLVAATVALPLTVAFALCGDAYVAVVLLAVITFCGVIAFGPAMAAIPLHVPNRMRAQVVALVMLLSTLFGAGVGPWLVAFFTEAVFGDPLALRYAIAVCAVLLLTPAIACFAAGARIARRTAAQ